jgi:hypothetical protein
MTVSENITQKCEQKRIKNALPMLTKPGPAESQSLTTVLKNTT